MNSAQSHALFLGGLGAYPLRKFKEISYFEIESCGTFCKIPKVTFISHDYVINNIIQYSSTVYRDYQG